MEIEYGVVIPLLSSESRDLNSSLKNRSRFDPSVSVYFNGVCKLLWSEESRIFSKETKKKATKNTLSGYDEIRQGRP